MGALDLDTVGRWFASLQWGQEWMSVALIGAAALVLVLIFSALRRPRKSKSPARPERPLDADHHFAAIPPITTDEVHLLQYLQEAFPDGAVLFRPRLSQFLSVRAGPKRTYARRRLGAMRIDYLLCADDGTPLYGFEIDLLRNRSDPLVQQQLVEKNRVLRSAGIRMIRFKGSVASWPPPSHLRDRVLATGAPSRGSDFEASRFASPSGFAPSGFAGTEAGRLTTVSSGIVRLSEMEPPQPTRPPNPWADTRKRS